MLPRQLASSKMARRPGASGTPWARSKRWNLDKCNQIGYILIGSYESKLPLCDGSSCPGGVGLQKGRACVLEVARRQREHQPGDNPAVVAGFAGSEPRGDVQRGWIWLVPEPASQPHQSRRGLPRGGRGAALRHAAAPARRALPGGPRHPGGTGSRVRGRPGSAGTRLGADQPGWRAGGHRSLAQI